MRGSRTWLLLGMVLLAVACHAGPAWAQGKAAGSGAAARKAGDDADVMALLKSGNAWCDEGKYAEALGEYEKALSLARGRHGDENVLVATCYSNIAATYTSKGDYTRALENFQLALKIQLQTVGESDLDTATCYHNIGFVCWVQGDYAGALENYHSALQIRLTVLGEYHPYTADTYNGIGAVYSSVGEYAKALENYQRALRIELKTLGDNHPDTSLATFLPATRTLAATYNNIGTVYGHLGHLARALKNYQRALQIELKTPGENLGTATCYHNIGDVHASQGDRAGALENYQRALQICLKTLGKKHSYTATCYHAIGLVYDSEGDYARALENYQRALQIRLKTLGENHPDTAMSYNQVGFVYNEQGDYSKALDSFQQALQIRLKTLGVNHSDTAISYDNLGAVYASQGDYARALDNFQRALQIFRKTVGETDVDTATCYNDVGAAYEQQGDYAKAMENYQRALQIQLATVGENTSDTARSYHNIGCLYFSQGHYTRALENLQRALQINLRRLGANHLHTGATYNAIGIAYEHLGDYASSLENLQRALQIRLKTLGENHSDTAMSYNNIGSLYAQQGNYAGALEQCRKAAASLETRGSGQGLQTTATSDSARILCNYASVALTLWRRSHDPALLREADGVLAQALDRVDRLRHSYGSEKSRLALGSSLFDVYPLAVEAALAMDALEPGRGHAARAFEAAEAGSARALLEAVAGSGAGDVGGVPAERLADERRLRARLASLEKQIADSPPLAPGHAQRVAALAERHRQSVAALDKAIAGLRRDYPRYAALQFPKAAPLAEIQASLGPDEAALEYTLGKDASHLFVVTRTGFAFRILPPAQAVEALASRLAQGAAGGRVRGMVPQEDRQPQGGEADRLALGNILLGPLQQGGLAQKLRGKALIVAVGGKLAEVPFEILPPLAGESGRFLVESHRVSYTPSLTLLRLTREWAAGRSPAPRRALIFADPVYAPADLAAQLADRKKLRTAANAALAAAEPNGRGADLLQRYRDSDATLDFRRIPSTRIEALAVARILGLDPTGGDVNLDVDATVGRWGRLPVEQYRYIHLAAHGILGWDRGLQPALVLSRVDAAGHPIDGFLTMKDLLDRPLHADLVVLSACQTGRGKLEKGEGVIGLSRAVLHAGASAVVVSLWSVNDASTADFMASFYRRLLGSDGHPAVPPAEALRQARLEMLHTGRNASYWAPFILVGKPD